MFYFNFLIFLFSFNSIFCLISEINELFFDNNDKLLYNSIIFIDSYCNIEINTNNIIQEIPSHIDLFLNFHLFNKFKENNCIAIYLLKGTPKSLITYPIEENIYDGTINYNDWLFSRLKKEIGWMSEYSNSLEIYFIRLDQEENNQQQQLVAILNPGEQNTVWLDTYIGHNFIIFDPETEQVIDDIIVEYDSFHTYGINSTRGDYLINFEKNVNILSGVQETLDHEYNRSLNVIRTFTPLGFDKGKLPKDLYASMITYYYNNYNSSYIEDWKELFHVNWWNIHQWMVGMPWGLKKYWQTRIRNLVEKWIGGHITLENSDIYGIRRYEEGAWLLSHVDREETHAVSVIINLDQENISKDWNVEIYDHGGRLHEIPMQPGEIIYYESAKSLHGRMTPLLSGKYTNIFSHYRPINDPEWYLKENPINTPLPIIDIDVSFQQSEMNCINNGEGQEEEESTSNQCSFGSTDDYEIRKANWIKKTMPYLSPQNEKISNSYDLFKYWKKVNHVDEKLKLNE